MVTKELKFRITDQPVSDWVAKINSVGGEIISRRSRESTVIYDDRADSVRCQRAALRLSSGRQYSIAYERSLSRRSVNQGLVLSTTVTSLAQMKKILRRIGFWPILSYAYAKTVWAIGATRVSLMECTFGTFLEVTGELQHISRMVPRLGLALSEAVTQSYDDLYREFTHKTR